MKRSLADWIDYQQTLHVRGVDLGLERIQEVARRMRIQRPAPLVITVAGTNGKGSTIAFLCAMLGAAGHRVGRYTSPHLLRYNERINIASVDVDDAALARAFERIEGARGDVPLTYFEFGTLAALWILSESALDVALLEVGLGGRLDAVNIIDADAAIVTTIDLDHQEYLGPDRDSIGREKAGVLRFGRPAVIAENDPPQGLLTEARRIGAEIVRADRDYQYQSLNDGWEWRNSAARLELPLPQLAAPCQMANAAGAIAVLHALRGRIDWNVDAIRHGVRVAHAAARLQRFLIDGIELIVDVAHNPQAAHVLSEWLRHNPARKRTFAVFGAMADKDVTGMAALLAPHITDFALAGLDRQTGRGLSATELSRCFAGVDASPSKAVYESPDAALEGVWRMAQSGDRILACGSFYIAAAALSFVKARNHAISR